MEEIAALIEEYDEASEVGVFIQPPETNDNSDYNSGYEENGLLNDLPDSLLCAECSSIIRLFTGENIIIYESRSNEDSTSEDGDNDHEFLSAEFRLESYPPKPPQIKSRKCKKKMLELSKDIT